MIKVWRLEEAALARSLVSRLEPRCAAESSPRSQTDPQYRSNGNCQEGLGREKGRRNSKCEAGPKKQVASVTAKGVANRTTDRASVIFNADTPPSMAPRQELVDIPALMVAVGRGADAIDLQSRDYLMRPASYWTILRRP